MPSFLQLEDLLTVSGMTPDIYYGWWQRDEEGRLVERGGVARHLTLLEGGTLNVNYASEAALRAAGVPEQEAGALIEARERGPLKGVGLASLGPEAARLPGGVPLGSGGSQAYTVRATAQLNGRPVRRTVAALIRFARDRSEPPIGVVRWYHTVN